MRYLLILMHCITCYMAHLITFPAVSACWSMLHFIILIEVHVDRPRIAPKVLTQHLHFKRFPGGGHVPSFPSLRQVIYGLTAFYVGVMATTH